MYIYQQQPKDGKGDRQVENKREKNQINDIMLQANTIEEKRYKDFDKERDVSISFKISNICIDYFKNI